MDPIAWITSKRASLTGKRLGLLLVLGLVGALLALGSVVVQASEGASGEGTNAALFSEDDLDARAAHGFPADSDHVRQITNSGADVGTAEYGFPMTQAEMDEVERRSAYVQSAHESGLVDAARARRDFAGTYVDHQADGQIVVLVTSSVKEAEAALRPLVPDGGAGMRIESAQFTFAQLEAAKDALMREPDGLRLTLSIDVELASVDEAGNRLVVAIHPSETVPADELRDRLVELLGVAVDIVVEAPSDEAVCNTRENCHTPYKAGIVIRQGSTTGTRCTMGFHIVVNVSSDEQFFTAGHCGHTGSNTWYHAATGGIGVELATLYVQNGVDIMRVQMSDSQDSNQIYGEGRVVTSSRNPMQNESVCSARGVSPAPTIDCGTVSDTSTSWIGGACQCTINGADTSGISIVLGDSGSPIYVRASSTSAVAIGVVNRTDGTFAKIQGALGVWGASIRD